MFSKALLHNVEEYENLKSSYEQLKHGAGMPIEHWLIGKPDKYPCICCYAWRYNDNGADTYEGDYVYIEDFDGLVVDPRAKMEDE